MLIKIFQLAIILVASAFSQPITDSEAVGESDAANYNILPPWWSNIGRYAQAPEFGDFLRVRPGLIVGIMSSRQKHAQRSGN